ncbi:MAG: DUF3871 family protein [Bacteroidaceae bacterium]|nr:DUF3871 family protein [Bacteroidaceae bacterium]
MNELVLMPAVANNSNNYDYVDYEEVVEQPAIKSNVSFLEANTNQITLDELRNQCVVPTWANQELTISHQDFIEAVHDAAQSFYQGETVTAPDIRVSHIVRGRTPNALGKRASELLECEKTQFYQRMAFAFTIPTIFETINGEKLELCIGGVRNYNDLNLYRASKGVEKFSIFVGWRVKICSNQVLSGQGVKLSMEVMSLRQLYQQTLELFYNFNPAKDIHLMQTLSNSYLTEKQFAQIVGRMRLYQALPPRYAKNIPQLLITDSQINSVCRGYFSNPDFRGKEGSISMWNFHNLLTESNKSSYIDSYLQRAVNATEVSVGLNNALLGDTTYQWFLG